jgi:hypothetical protein
MPPINMAAAMPGLAVSAEPHKRVQSTAKAAVNLNDAIFLLFLLILRAWDH